MDTVEFRQGLRDGVPIAPGILRRILYLRHDAVSGGLSPWQATHDLSDQSHSAGQFAGLDIILAAGSSWENGADPSLSSPEILSDVFLPVSEAEKNIPWGHRLAVAFGVTDEIFGVERGPGRSAQPLV